MSVQKCPDVFLQLQSYGCISSSDIINTQDGFWMIYRSLSDILAEKGIFDFPDADGTRLACDKFYDDWFLYAVAGESSYTYGLLKLREQEYDLSQTDLADGDTPGVTVSFISFACDTLTECLAFPDDENRQRLDREINRVVARRGERHHRELKRYFVNKKAAGSCFVADLYIKHIASFACDGYIDAPEHYKAHAKKGKGRILKFIVSVNQAAGYVVCDNEKIYIQNKESLNKYERAAILVTHTGNTSEESFAAEVKFHAGFLSPLARIKLPFVRRSAYDSAIRADMTVAGKETALLAPFYKLDRKLK